MRETITAIVWGACGSLLANAILFATMRLRRWGASRLRILLALNVTALIGGGVAFAYIAWESIAHGTPLPVGGSVVVGGALVALVVLGYFFCLELVKATSVRATLTRIDAILGQQDAHLDDAPELADALSSALTALRNVLAHYGSFFEGGRAVVRKELVSLLHMSPSKATIELAWDMVQMLVRQLRANDRFRHASIITDEAVEMRVPGAGYEWVIDPIDGSRHIARDVPLFTISIALLKNDEVFLGVTYAPVTDELFFALKGRGAYMNAWENRLWVSKTGLDKALLHVEFPNRDLMAAATGGFLRQCESLEQILSKVYRIRGLGLGSLGLAYVAKGSFDGYVTLTGTTLRNDVCAGLLLVEEAGGKVATFAVPPIVEGNVRVLAANESIFDEIMTVVRT